MSSVKFIAKRGGTLTVGTVNVDESRMRNSNNTRTDTRHRTSSRLRGDTMWEANVSSARSKARRGNAEALNEGSGN